MGWLRWDSIRTAIRENPPSRVLEIGAGEGAMAHRLARRYAYVGLEPDPTSFEVLQQRLRILGAGEARRGSIDSVGDAESFDLICAFEVLEHIDDDVGALRTWREHLDDNGILLLSVPAHSRRFGPADEAVGHHRRYDREPLIATLRAGGFEVVRICSYGMLAGHATDRARACIAAREELPSSREARTGASGRFLQPRNAATGSVRWAAALPFRILQRPLARTDRGIGYVVTARRV